MEDQEKINKFRELEETGADEEMVNFTKAAWLTSRANHFGKIILFSESEQDSTEAINFKSDYLPAYLSLAIALTFRDKKTGQFHIEEGRRILNRAPGDMKISGKIIVSKVDIVNAFEEMVLASKYL